MNILAGENGQFEDYATTKAIAKSDSQQPSTAATTKGKQQPWQGDEQKWSQRELGGKKRRGPAVQRRKQR
jgi:hypothetical protein